MQGHERSKGMSKSKMGLRSLGEGSCYDCDTKSTPVPPVTPVVSLDLISYSGLSS